MNSRTKVFESFTLITDDGEFRALAGELARTPVLGFDTEFERSRTFHARLALIQLHDAERGWLVDPLAVKDLSPLTRLVQGYPGVMVMHSPMEDLEILSRLCGATPSRLFDTQLAAAFVGRGFGLGYDRLLQTLFGLDISKAATRSDWLRRPLSRDQLEYAAADCAYLPAAHDVLSRELASRGRTSWLEEEVAALVRRGNEREANRDFSRLVRRIDDDHRVRARLLALCRWREDLARRQDRPRRHIADDTLLVECAARAPRSVAALREIPDLDRHRRRIADAALVAAVAAADEAPDVPRPGEAEDLRPYRSLIRRMKVALEPLAKELGMPADLLAPRRLLEQLIVARLIRREPVPEPLQGWRAAVVLPALLAVIESAG